jgi:geranylgeranyl pyrophosphate synthase
LKNESFSAWVEQSRVDIDLALEAGFDALEACAASGLLQAMRYTTLGGGKRFRGLLVLACAKACGHATLDLMPAACAVEALHAYSLVHDDLPCMDNDDLRRGQPTCHKKFGEAVALLAGDALQSLAFEWLVNSRLPAESKLRQLDYLSKAAGLAGMAGGQAIDGLHVGKIMDLPNLKIMHEHKTGALIRAAVLLGATGARLPDEPVLDALKAYAEHVGLAFQVVDDILDVESDSAALGKTPGKDALHNKPTMASLLGLSAAHELAQALHAQAYAALAPLGPSADCLRKIADQVIERRS